MTRKTRPDQPEDDGFLSRWSRLKQEQRDEMPEVAPAQAGSPPAESAPAEPAAPVDPESLPDIESLTAESDFTPFLREGVPAALRERALRRLWRLNPVFANLDGLNDYDQDYSDAATVIKGLKSLYQVGKGIGRPSAETAAGDRPAGGAQPDERPSEPDGPAVPEATAEAPVSDSAPATASDGDAGRDPATDAAAPAVTPSGEGGAAPADRTADQVAERPVSGGGRPRAARRRWGQFET